MWLNQRDGDRIYTIEQFWDDETCREWIDRAEAIGFAAAPIGSDDWAVYAPEIRDNDRVMLDDDHLARLMFERARPFLPATRTSTDHTWTLDGLNPRLRFYRYAPGQKFAPHYDGHYHAADGSKSFLTFLVYLQGGMDGGSTRFYRKTDSTPFEIAFEVRPEAGTALIFAHDELHEGAPVVSGRKYVVRSDVMYRRITP